jgi:hypothetical protein
LGFVFGALGAEETLRIGWSLISREREMLKIKSIEKAAFAGVEELLKGGPGSGPHPGDKTKEAENLSQKASDIHSKTVIDRTTEKGRSGAFRVAEAHGNAAAAHARAATAHEKAGNAKQAAYHREKAKSETSSYRSAARQRFE